MNTEGTIQSPNHPNNYPNNVDCQTVLQAPPEYVVRLDIIEFALQLDEEQEGICQRDGDILKLYDGDNNSAPTLGEFCGKYIPKAFISSSRHLFVLFKSDGVLSNSGFLASVSFIKGNIEDKFDDILIQISLKVPLSLSCITSHF